MDEVEAERVFGKRLGVSSCNKVIINDRLTSVWRQGNASLLERTVLCCFKGTLDHCCFNLRCLCKSCFDLNLDLLLHGSRNLLFFGLLYA